MLTFKHTGAIVCALIFQCWLPLISSTGEKIEDPDETLLQQRSIGIDTKSIKGYLNSKSRWDIDLLRIEELIQQLGAKDFKKRQEAEDHLVGLGPNSLAMLRKASLHLDKEIARKAHTCVERIEAETAIDVPRSAVRLLLKAKGEGVGETLLRYLPYAGTEAREEIYFGLTELLERKNFDIKDLKPYLKDELPDRRALAGLLLAARGFEADRAEAVQLLKDRSPSVRLRVCQGLIAGGDKRSIHPLIQLLDVDSLAVAWQAEELLHFVARNDGPRACVESGKPTTRREAVEGWKKWWDERGKHMPLGKEWLGKRSPRLCLVTCGQREGKGVVGEVGIYGGNGTRRWSWQTTSEIEDAQVLEGDRFLLAERVDELVADKLGLEDIISERTPEGHLVAKSAIPFGTQAMRCVRLGNGWTFISRGEAWLRLDSTGKVAFPKNKEGRPAIEGAKLGCATLLPNGRVLGVRSYKPAELVEVDLLTNKTLHCIPLPEVRASLERCQIEATGSPRYLLLVPASGEFLEVNREGRIEWRREAKDFTKVSPLRGGNLLVADRERSCVAEITRKGKELWRTERLRTVLRVRPCFSLLSVGFPKSGDE